MATNRDFRDLFSELCDAGADFIVVGGHAVMFHTVPRFTKDIDVLVRPTADNARRVYAALARFGAPLGDLSVDDLAVEGTIFQIGVAPNRVDVLTSIEAVTFDDAWQGRARSTYDGVPISVLGLAELIRNKRAVDREQDRIDVKLLEQVRGA